MSVLGDFVKLGEEFGLEQAALALHLGVHQQTVSKGNRGRRFRSRSGSGGSPKCSRVDLSDLMRYAGYLPDAERVDPQAEEPFHQLIARVSRLTNDQLVVLIPAWRSTGARQNPTSGPQTDRPARRRR